MARTCSWHAMHRDSISVTGDSADTSAKSAWSSEVLTFSQPLDFTGRSMQTMKGWLRTLRGDALCAGEVRGFFQEPRCRIAAADKCRTFDRPFASLVFGMGMTYDL